MPLTLSVPRADAIAHITADYRAGHVRDWLDSLPLARPVETATALNDHLYAFNRSPMPAIARLELLELYCQHIDRLTPFLTEHYIEKPLPLSGTHRDAALAARELYNELAMGYKLILVEHVRGGQQETDLPLHLVLQRALYCLGQVLLVCYGAHAPVPPYTWQEMHRILHYALEQDLAEEPVQPPAALCVSLTYRQAVLLALLDPYHLTFTDIRHAQDYLNRFAGCCHILAAPPTQRRGGLFAIQCEEDAAPRLFSQLSPSIPVDLVLETTELLHLLHGQIQRLHEGAEPRSMDLPPAAVEPVYQSLLRKMLGQWHEPGKRRFRRNLKLGRIALQAGLSAVTAALSSMQQREAAPGEWAPMVNATPSQWRQVNESATGLALICGPGTRVTLRVGEVVAIRANDTAWRIGVVRWLQSEGQVQIGVQFLAHTAEATMITPLHNPHALPAQPALWLEPIASIRSMPALLAPRGTFSMGQAYLLEDAQQQWRVRATAWIEQTNCFDLVEFAPLADSEG